MEAEITTSGSGHQKENRKDLICEESAVDKFPEALLELTSSVTKQNQDEKIEGIQPNGCKIVDLVDVSKDTKRISSSDDVKFETSEKFMEEQAVMSTEVQTEGEKKHFESEEFCETPSKTKAVSIISSDEYGSPESLDIDLKETNEQETYASTSATKNILRMQNQIQKNPKEHGAEISDISADEFPQNTQAESGDLSSLLTNEKLAATVSFETVEDNNLMKSSEPKYSKQNENRIRKNEDQKEAQQEIISSMSLQQNSTVPINLLDSLKEVEDGTVEAFHEIGKTDSENQKLKDMNFSPPGKTVEAIPVEEQNFHKENISSTSENPIPEKHDNKENMDTGDSTFVKNLMLVKQQKCELDESNKEAALMLNKQLPKDIRSVADEWTQNSTKELKEQIVETTEDGSNGKKSIGSDYKKICEYLSEEDNVDPVNQGNTTSKKNWLTKETMTEKQKTPFYTENKEERSSLDVTEGEYSEESRYLSSESSGYKDINNLENVTDGKISLLSDKHDKEEGFKSEDVCEDHSPSTINSSKELPLKEGKNHETGAETCDNVAEQLKVVIQKLDREADDLYLQQPSVDIDLQQKSIQGEGREKASETEYVEEDIEIDGVDKRLDDDENVSEFIKEETTRESIGSLSTEENNMNITGVEDKGSLDATESFDKDILPTKEEAVENVTDDNEKDGELLEGIQYLNAERALELTSMSDEKLQKNLQFSEIEAFSSNTNAGDDVNEEINFNSLTIEASAGEMADKAKVEANEKKKQTLADSEYICTEIFLQNKDENVTVFQASKEETFHEVESSDCGPSSQTSISNNMGEGRKSSEAHEKISTFMSEKNDLEIFNERITNNLDNRSVQGMIEDYAEQKETPFSEPVKTTSSALKEYNPEADNMAKKKAIIQQGTSEQATDEAILKKDQTNSEEVSCTLSRDADESPELVSLPARKEIDGKVTQYNKKNDAILEGSQNLDAELTLERTRLTDTCLEKNQLPLEVEPFCKYITSDHKADDESTITSSTLQASIGKKMDKLKQEELDETVVLVSKEKAPETTLGLASESMEDVATKANIRQESNQYTSYVNPSTEEASSQQGKIEIKFSDAPKAAIEEQSRAKTDEGYRCEGRHLQNKDESIAVHHGSLTHNSLEEKNIVGYPVSHASVGNNLKKYETNCQTHEKMSSSVSDKRELENADHDEAAANEVTGEAGDTEHKKHEGHITQADETRIPEVENKHKMIKEGMPEEQDAESGSLNHSRMHERLEKKDIPDESCHRDYLETVNKNNKSSTNESKHSDKINKDIISEALDQSIPKLQNQQDLDAVKEIIKGATELVPEVKDHESCNENCNIGSENDSVNSKNPCEPDIPDVPEHLEPVVHVKSEQKLKVVEDNSGQSLFSSEPLPIEKNLHNEMEPSEIRLTSDTIKCESPKKLDIKDMTCPESPDQSVFQAQTEENMHLIYEHNGKPKDDSDDSETASKEEESESCVKMINIKTSNTQSSMDKHGGKDSLEDEVASETDSLASYAAQITDLQKGEGSATVHKSNLEEQQVDSITTGTCQAEELAGLVTITEAYSRCHENKRVDEEPIKIETIDSSIQISQETMEKQMKSSSLDMEDKNPKKMPLIQDIPLVESKEEDHPLLEIMQTEAIKDILKNESTDNRICLSKSTVEKLVEDSNLEMVEIPEENGSVKDIPKLEVYKKEDSTKVIFQTKDSKKLAVDIVDDSSSTHDSVREVIQENVKLEDCSVNELEREIPKETTTFEGKPEVEVENKQDSVVDLMHRENTETQIEQVSTNRIQDSNQGTSQEYVCKIAEACGLKLQEETLEQVASLIDIPQVEARMQDDSFNVHEERNKVFIRDDMDVSTTHEALRVIPQEYADSSKDSSQLKLQTMTPTRAVCNIQALEGNRHEYGSQNKESSKELQVIQDSIQESMQEETENPDHSHLEIQRVDLEEPSAAEDTRCLETAKQERAAAEALKEESTQNFVNMETADLRSFSATISSAEDIVWQSKENPSKPSNFTLQEKNPEEKSSFEESGQMENENEEDLAKEKLQKEEKDTASSSSRETVLKTLQEHPDLLEEAPRKDLRVPSIQGSLQIEEEEEEEEEEWLAPNMNVHMDINHDEHKKEELRPCFKAAIEKGNVHGEKSDMDHEKHVKSPELESEEETSEIVKLSGDIKDQPEGESNMSLIQASICETEETEKTRGIPKADPLEQRHQTTKSNEYQAKKILAERLTTDNVQEAQNEKSEKEESKEPPAAQAPLGQQIEADKTKDDVKAALQEETMKQARMGQVSYSDEIKRETRTSLATKAREEEMIEEVVPKVDSRKHDNIPNSMSSEQIHILTDAMEQKISKDYQIEALISVTHEKQKKEQDSGNKLQNDLEGVDLTEDETQDASGTRKSIDIDCQNKKKPSYTEVPPVIQASIKETLPAELEERTGISNLVSEEETSELIGANDDTNIKSKITKGKEFTDLQAEEDQINIQGMKEDITERQRTMTLPEVATDKQGSDGVDPSFTKETMKAKDRESNEKRELNIKMQTDGLSEDKTAGPSMGMEGPEQERNKSNNRVQLMTMKDEENDNLPFSSETTTESGISTEKNKDAVREVSLPVDERDRERIEISKTIEIQNFQNDEALHICTTQLAAKEVVQVETGKVQEISDLVMELEHHEKDKTNLKYDTPIYDESQNLPSKVQVITQRRSQDEEKYVKTLDANSAAEIKKLQSSHGESLDSTISEEKKGSTENLSSFSDIHASADKNNLQYAKDEVPPRPLVEPEMESCEFICESEYSKPCVQDKIDLQEKAVVSTEKEKKDGEEFDSHPEASTKYVEMVDGNRELKSRTEVEVEKQYKQSDDQPAGEVKMSSQKVNEPRERKLQTKADQACDETTEGTQVMDSSSKNNILPKEENKVDQQGLVQEVLEKIEKEDASGDKKPEEIGQTVAHETRVAQKDLEIIDNMTEQAQAMDLGKTTDEKNMKMGERFIERKHCAVNDSSNDKPTPCTKLVFSDESAEEREGEEHKHEESGFEAAAKEDSLQMKSTAVVKDDSPHYKKDTVRADLVHPEKNAEGPDEEESKQEESGSVAPVLEESSGTTDCKPAHKKHNILSSVGSKVKQSIGKVKKAITGKSSHHKPHSPKEW